MSDEAMPTLPPGARLGAYRVVRRAGAGGMGTVYLARDVDLDRPVALKVLRRADGADRFVREARAAARLNHPNVAAVYAAGRDGPHAYLALEWVDGVTLAEHLRASVILDWAEATAAVRDAAAGLAAAHAAGVVHRDVKPANLMRAAADGRVKVVDFGLAFPHDAPTDLTASGIILGTPAYLSPEQCRGERGTAASDVYALGCTLYHLLTSRPPFDPSLGLAGLIHRHLTEPVPDARRYADDVPAAVLAVVARATAKPPADRYPDAAAMLADLDAALAGDGPTVVTPAEPPPPADGPHNLPSPTTSFVGRSRELGAVKTLVRDGGGRLVTLVGPGGAGKTRLAVRAAADLLGHHPDGTWFVDLSAATTPDAVGPSVAAVVGVRPAGRGDPTEAVVEHLRPLRGLLVLDNCEHLVAAAAAVAAAVVAACPGVRVLATSRSPLAVAGEAEYRVGPLSSPPPPSPPENRPVPLADLRQAEAVRLLVDRATLVRPGFALTEANAADVAAVCRQLDGMPLALELAAARLKTLSVRQLAERLGDALGLLTGGPRTAAPRQRTLRAVLDWSHDLLAPAERVALARLSVFAASASLEAIEAVLPGPADSTGPADPIARADVIDLVAALVDQSLLVAEDRDGTTRYRQLDVVRHYAAERLARAGDRPAVEARHLAFLADLAVAVWPRLNGPDQAAALAQLDADHDNVRAALDRAGGSQDAQRLLGYLCRYWMHRGNAVDGLARSRAVLAAAGDEPCAHTADACNTAGTLAYNLGDFPEATRYYERGLAAARQFGDVEAEATAHTTLGTVYKDLGDLPQARHHTEAALELRRRQGRPAAIAGATNNLGSLLMKLAGDLDRARDLYYQAQSLYRDLGDSTWVAYIDLNLGAVELKAGRPAAARDRYAAARTALEAIGDLWSRAYAVQGLGECDLADGHPADARRQLTEALDTCRQYGDRAAEAEVLDGLARATLADGDRAAALAASAAGVRLARAVGDPLDTANGLQTLATILGPTDPARAAALLGVAGTVRSARGLALFGPARAAHDQLWAFLSQTLGPDAFEAAVSTGAATHPDAVPLPA